MAIGIQSTLAFANYYAGLLILQYLNKLKATATIQGICGQAAIPQTPVQTIAFSAAPGSGTFTIVYTPFGVNQVPLTTTSINWNDSASTIQTKLQAVTGLGSVTVAGSIAGKLLTITMTGVIAPANLLTTTNALGGSVTLSVSTTDVTLPLAVLNGFNLLTTGGATPAIGAQLNILGEYVGVTRSGFGFNGQYITLSDADFLTLIQFATIKNTAGSSLATIVSLLTTFFPNEIITYDLSYINVMTMQYALNSSIGSQNLAQLLVTQNILPKPMGVLLYLPIYAPTINKFFGFRTYDLNTTNNSPFNTYDVYNSGTPWLTYDNVV
jgi:hypothetical protein